MVFNSDNFIFIVCILFLFYIIFYHNKIESFKDPVVDRLKADLIKIEPRAAYLSFNGSTESFSENKKHVYICLRDKNNEYYPYNMLMYVALHELAHCMSEQVDENHTTDEFKNNFNKYLKLAEKAGIYDSKQPLIYDYCKSN